MFTYMVSVIEPEELNITITTNLSVLDALDVIRRARRLGFEWMLERITENDCVVLQTSSQYRVLEDRAIGTLNLV